jgi:hypothetical protein
MYRNPEPLSVSTEVASLRAAALLSKSDNPPLDAASLDLILGKQRNHCMAVNKSIKEAQKKWSINEKKIQSLYDNTIKEYNISKQTIINQINNHNEVLLNYSTKEYNFIKENNEILKRFNTTKKKFEEYPELISYINKLKEIQNLICGQPRDIYHSVINDSNIKIHTLPDTSCDHIIMDFKEPKTSEPSILQWFKVNKFLTYSKNSQKKYLFSNIDSIEIKQTYKTKVSDIKIPNALGDNMHDYNFTKKEKERMFNITKINNIDTYDINDNEDISTGSFTEVKINTRNQDNTSESLYIKKGSLVIGWNIIILNPYTLKVEEYKNFYDDPEEIDLTQEWESASGKIVSDDKTLINENVFTNWGGRCYSKDREWGVEHKGTHDCSPHIINKDGKKIIMGKKYLPIASWAPSSAKEDCAKNKYCKVLSCDASEFNGGHNRWVDPDDHTKYLSQANKGMSKVVSEDVITGKGVCNAYGFRPINWRESVNESKQEPTWTLDNGMTGEWSWDMSATYELGKYESGKECKDNCIDNRNDWKLNKVYLKPEPNPITKASTKAFNDMNEWFNKNKKKYDKHIVIITVQNPLLQKASKADSTFNVSFNTLMKLCSCNLTSKDLKLNDTNNSENPQFLNIIGKINININGGKNNNVGTYGCIWKNNNFNSDDGTPFSYSRQTNSVTNDSLTTIISKNNVKNIFNSPNQQNPTYKLDENKGNENINLINLIKADIDLSKCNLPFSKFKINNTLIYDNKQGKEYPITKLANLIFKPNIIEQDSLTNSKHKSNTYEENNDIITILTEIYKLYKNDTIPEINWKNIKLNNDDEQNNYKMGVEPVTIYKPCSSYQDCNNIPEWGKQPYSTKKQISSDVSWIKQKRDLEKKEMPEFPPVPTRTPPIPRPVLKPCAGVDIEGFQSNFQYYYNNKINIYTLLYFLLLITIVYVLFYILDNININKKKLNIYFTIIAVIIIITFIIILNL